MKLTRRSLLKALGIGVPVAAVASEVAAEPSPAPDDLATHVEQHQDLLLRPDGGGGLEWAGMPRVDHPETLRGSHFGDPCTSMHLFEFDTDFCRWCGIGRDQVEMAGIDPETHDLWAQHCKSPTYSARMSGKTTDGPIDLYIDPAENVTVQDRDPSYRRPGIEPESGTLLRTHQEWAERRHRVQSEHTGAFKREAAERMREIMEQSTNNLERQALGLPPVKK